MKLIFEFLRFSSFCNIFLFLFYYLNYYELLRMVTPLPVATLATELVVRLTSR